MEVAPVKSPDEIKIEVTYKCPLACIHCSSDAHSDNHLHITFEKCQEIIKQAHEMGIEKISFSGGEPLVWEGINQAIKFASGFGMRTTIYTCGNIPDYEKTFSSLRSSGLHKAIFSLYSSNRTNHELITRIRGSFDNTINSIKECLKNGIDTEIHFVAVSQTFNELEDIVTMCKTIGVQKLSVLRFVPQGRGKLFSQGIMSRDENLQLIRTIKRLRKNGYSIRTGSPLNVLLLNEHPGCYAAQDRIVITPDLRVYPCDAFKQIPAEKIVDTVNRSELTNSSLQECWDESPYLNTIRSAVASAAEPPCNSCSNYALCLSGCLAQKFLYYNSLKKIQDPACLKR